MSSSEGVTISMEDSTEDVAEKVNSAFCPPTRDPEGDLENPVLELFEYHVFPRFDEIIVERPRSTAATSPTRSTRLSPRISSPANSTPPTRRERSRATSTN